MSLDAFVSQGWADHAGDALGVMARFPAGIALVTEVRHLAPFAALVTHVSAEHLGRYVEGIALLTGLQKVPLYDARTPEGKAVLRSMAVLHLCAGNLAESARCETAAGSGGAFPAASDRIRVLAVASSALAGQHRIEEASAMFSEALALAAYGPSSADPAARAMAVTGNNLASELEQRKPLAPRERALMLEAARAGRRFWQIAGTWHEVERAEYRLAQSHLAAGDAESAVAHAAHCLAIVEANGNEPGEAFFAREVSCLARRAAGDAAGATSEREAAAAVLPSIEDAEFRAMCEDALHSLSR